MTFTGIITPSACTPSLSADGIVDHGRVPARSLNHYEFTKLPTRNLDLEVSCNEPVLFVLVGVDNRAASSVGPGFYYGLGNNIHAPSERPGLRLAGDSRSLRRQRARTGAGVKQPGRDLVSRVNAYPDNFMGFATPGTLVPEPHRRITATLQIDTSINAAAFLTLDQEVPLDGSIVLDLRYL
ncbi:DUF1120 domain-containing protein [Pseudomonas poae]